jgi:hypothetical protein
MYTAPGIWAAPKAGQTVPGYQFAEAAKSQAASAACRDGTTSFASALTVSSVALTAPRRETGAARAGARLAQREPSPLACVYNP